jgi:hypothetical protein
LLIFAYLTTLGLDALNQAPRYFDSGQSRALTAAPGNGVLHVTILERNESSLYEKTPVPVTVRQSDAPLNYPVIIYARVKGVLEAHLPAGEDYIVEVLHPFLSVSVYVHIMQDKLANLTIRIDKVARQATFFEFQGSNSLGLVSNSGDFFIQIPPLGQRLRWNSTFVQSKSLIAHAGQGSGETTFTRNIEVSVIDFQNTGRFVIMELRPSSPLNVSELSSLVFLAFSSRYEIDYLPTDAQVLSTSYGSLQVP